MSASPAPQADLPRLARGAEPARIEAARLFGAQREVVIVHRGEAYRLRITRQDKLILTK